jgi:hypothetical protein
LLRKKTLALLVIREKRNDLSKNRKNLHFVVRAWPAWVMKLRRAKVVDSRVRILVGGGFQVKKRTGIKPLAKLESLVSMIV